MALIDFNVHNQIALLTANRPQVRNALNLQAMEEFAAAIDQAQATPNLRALIVTGAGKAFISGGDLNELHTVNTESEALRMITLMGEALNRLAALPCLTLAAMEGPARGGGAEIALACDWRVAAEDADLGFVQIRLGLTTGWGGAARLRELVGYAHALDLLVLGRVVTAREAHNRGLVTYLTPPDEALQGALDLADGLAQFDPEAIQAYKRILQAGQPALEASQATERAEFPKLWVGPAHRAAVEKFLGKT